MELKSSESSTNEFAFYSLMNKATNQPLTGSQTDRIEVHSNDLPHSAPLKSHSVHVVVTDLNDLLYAEHARTGWAGEFLV